MSAADRDPPRQGDIWWAEVETSRRPVLVVSRPGAADYLVRLVVAPVTRSVRAIPTHLELGPESGLRTACAATFDNLVTVPVAALTHRIGRIDMPRTRICQALSAMAYC